ncbi:MAG: hypothetical protein JNM63_16270 [Spirochaetia bacterium]|nr:hypothetical protein [Spirochaetia bacterium]
MPKPIFQIASILLTAAVVVFIASCSRKNEVTKQGHDFIEEARWIHSVLISGKALPENAGLQKELDAHRAILEKKAALYRKNFVEKAGPFLKERSPKHLPEKLVYPFGGGDLAAAIASFPEATEITTISLESAGDPRHLPKTNLVDLKKALADVRRVLGTYYDDLDNNNVNVVGLEKTDVPSQVALSIGEAALYGYSPVSLRFFRVETDGSLHYFGNTEIASLENTKGVKIHGGWFNPICSHAFLNMEIVYTRDGKPKQLVHRHFSANLEDSEFDNSPLLAHLKRKGKISAMTKAAAYLMWRSDFSKVRDYLLSNMTFMISDSTGILPEDAKRAGFTPESYGVFNGAFVSKKDLVGKSNSRMLREWWKAEPYRTLPFRYGYSDIYGSNHLIIFRPASVDTKKPAQ